MKIEVSAADADGSIAEVRFFADTNLIGVVTNAQTFGPCEVEPHHPELFWYGIHGVEALFTVMGTGCWPPDR